MLAQSFLLTKVDGVNQSGEDKRTFEVDKRDETGLIVRSRAYYMLDGKCLSLQCNLFEKRIKIFPSVSCKLRIAC